MDESETNPIEHEAAESPAPKGTHIPRADGDRARVHERVTEVYNLLMQGAGFRDIRAFAAEHGWNVGLRQLRKYKSFAEVEMRKRIELRRDRIMILRLNRLEYLYARAVAAGDMRTALDVQREAHKLEGLYPAKKQEITGKDGGPIQTQSIVAMTDEQRQAALSLLMARVGAAGAGSNPAESADAAGSAMGRSDLADETDGDESGPLAGAATPLSF